MAEINKINVGGTNYDIRDNSKVPLIHSGINGWIEIELDTHSFANGMGSGEINSDTFPIYKYCDSGSIAISNYNAQSAFCAENIEFGNIQGASVIGLRGHNIEQERAGGQLYLKVPDLGGNSNPMNIISSTYTPSEGPIIQIGDNLPPLNLIGTTINIHGGSFVSHCVTTLNTTTITKGPLYPAATESASKYILPSGGKYYYVTNNSSGTASADTELLTLGTLKNSTNSTELTVSASNPTLSFGSEHTIGWVGGVELKVTMPSNTSSSDTKVKVTTGTNTKAYVLGVNSSGYSSGSATDKVITDTGVYLNTTAGQIAASTFWATSDKRLKENIIPYSCDKSILDLPVYKYNFIKDPDKLQHIGCLAQDLQEICPEAVFTEDDGYLVINESKIVYLLLDEVKKLKQEIVELKKGN